MPEEQRLASMHVVDTRGRVHSAGAAVVVLLSLNPRTRVQSWLARLLPPVGARIDREYQKLAARRAELSAEVPDAEPTVVPPRWTALPGDGVTP